MKSIQTKLVLALLVLLLASSTGYSQEPLTNKLEYEIYRIYPPISISKIKLKEAINLADLNKNYKSDWVKKYISVSISANSQGELKTIMGKDAKLNQAQKHLLNTVDLDTDISINVRYLPDNNLAYNEVKEMLFTCTIEPETEARYPYNKTLLRQYLKESIIDKIPSGVFEISNLAAIKFTVNEEGEISNLNVFESSKNEKTDALLLKSIRKMPKWTPATYSNGLKVKQEFVVIVGDMKSCVLNLLNINQD